MIAAADASTILAIFGGLFGLALTIGTVLAFLRAGLAKTTIELQKEEIGALTQRLDTVSGELDATKARMRSLETTNEVLKELATGAGIVAKFANDTTLGIAQLEQATRHILERLDQLGTSA